jgi:ankyrin repeat protein
MKHGLCQWFDLFSIQSHTLNFQHRWTPLIWATNNGHVECVRLLLENRADKDAKDEVRVATVLVFLLPLLYMCQNLTRPLIGV